MLALNICEGYCVTVKPFTSDPLCPPSLGLCVTHTVHCPTAAPDRSKVAVSCVGLIACTFVPAISALPDLVSLAVIPLRKLVPKMVTLTGPVVGPLLGEIALIVGAALTVKYSGLLHALQPALLYARMFHEYFTPACNVPVGTVNELEAP